MSGSVSPLVGSTPMLTPMLISACAPSHRPKPSARYDWNLSPARDASCAIQKLRHTSAMNSASVAATPTSPSRSEERRVGKECRDRGGQDREKKKKKDNRDEDKHYAQH